MNPEPERTEIVVYVKQEEEWFRYHFPNARIDRDWTIEDPEEFRTLAGVYSLEPSRYEGVEQWTIDARPSKEHDYTISWTKEGPETDEVDDQPAVYTEAALAILDATLSMDYTGNPYDSIGLAARLLRDALDIEQKTS